MKKQHLCSLATMIAAFCAPVGYPIYAQDPVPAVQEEQTELSADQFIDRFCGSVRQTILPDGKTHSEFIWFSSLTPENIPIIAQGREQFDRLPAATQQIIIQAARAHQVEYLTLSQQAVEAHKAKEPDDQNKIKEEQPSQASSVQSSSQVSSQKESSSSQSSSTTGSESAAGGNASFQSQASASEKPSAGSLEQSQKPAQADSPVESQQPSQEKAEENKEQSSSQTPAPAPEIPAGSSSEQKPSDQIQNSAPSEDQHPSADQNKSSESPSQEQAQPQQPAAPSVSGGSDKPSDGGASPASGQGSSQAAPAPSPQNQGPVALPENPGTIPAGLTSRVMEEAPDDQQMAVGNLLAQKAGFDQWQLLQVVYSYQIQGQQVDSVPYLFLQSPTKTIIFQIVQDDEQSVTVQFFNDRSCTYDLGLQKLVLGTSQEMTFLKESSPAHNETRQSAPAEQPSSEKEAAAENEIANALPAPREAVQDLQTKAAQSPDSAQPVQQQSTAGGEQTDPAADAFLERYVMVQGSLIRSVSQANYQQILNGLGNWEQLSAAQKQAVNSYLTAHSSQTFQQLYRQANLVRLGMPLRALKPQPAAQGVQKAPSVQTGTIENLALWLTGATVSLQGLLILKLKPKEHE